VVSNGFTRCASKVTACKAGTKAAKMAPSTSGAAVSARVVSNLIDSSGRRGTLMVTVAVDVTRIGNGATGFSRSMVTVHDLFAIAVAQSSAAANRGARHPAVVASAIAARLRRHFRSGTMGSSFVDDAPLPTGREGHAYQLDGPEVPVSSHGT
jgi:hypothetical protein